MSAGTRRILYVQYANPGMYPPVEHSSRILADAGWRVVFLGIHASGSARRLLVPHHPRIRALLMSHAAPGWRQKLHYLAYCVWVLVWSIVWRPHRVYLSDPLACPIGWLLATLGVRVVYHEHDSPNGPPVGRFQQFVRHARRRLSQCAYVVLPNAERLREFQRDTGGGEFACIVWNCPALSEVGPERATKESNRTTLFYVGVLGPTMLPLTVIDALVKCPPMNLSVVGYETIGHPHYSEQLVQRAQREGVADRITIHRSLPRLQFYAVARTCDVGLMTLPLQSEELNIRHLLGASNKSFDYLACGLALLVSDLPDWTQTFANGRYGMTCNPSDGVSIANAMHWFHDHPDETRAMGEAGRKRVLADWNYETQFEPVKQYLERPRS